MTVKRMLSGKRLDSYRIILTISRITGGISREVNRVTGRLAPKSWAIPAMTVPAIE